MRRRPGISSLQNFICVFPCRFVTLPHPLPLQNSLPLPVPLLKPLKPSFPTWIVDLVGKSEDTTEGPQFKLPDLASRDVKAHNLSREAGRRLREKSRLFGKAGLPLPRGRSASPGLQGLSPAAQKFVKKVMAKAGSGVDETLRASYRASPLPFGTPKTASRSHSRFGRESSLRSPSCP